MFIHIKYEYFEILDSTANVATKLYNAQLDIYYLYWLTNPSVTIIACNEEESILLSQLDYFKQNKPFQYKLVLKVA